MARVLAASLKLPPEAIRVRVVEFQSQQIYLFGEVIDLPRAVPYQGPETVLDLLQRVGGITPGAAPGDVQVVRTHISEGRPPEVFHVNLRAIVANQDQRTNVRLQPYDRVHVGQTRKACLEKCVPPWLRPAYQFLCGLRRLPGE
jgi:protein involved in polysaccharide export with SLBB domain